MGSSWSIYTTYLEIIQLWVQEIKNLGLLMKNTEEINRKYIKLRYKLLPYIYDTMWKCSKCGAPIIRPLLFNYQNDKNTYEINDEFICGDNILVAPVVEQGAKARMLYLPEGE